jgi:hypothetical protein
MPIITYYYVESFRSSREMTEESGAVLPGMQLGY